MIYLCSELNTQFRFGAARHIPMLSIIYVVCQALSDPSASLPCPSRYRNMEYHLHLTDSSHLSRLYPQ